MTSTEICFLGLIDVGRRIRSRELSSVDVTQAVLERIARLDDELRSYATVTPEMALEAARDADREIAQGSYRGPLHGVPIAVKDLCHTKGIITAAGMALYKNFVPDRDATVVSRLKASGAVLIGKLQMTEGAFSAHHPSIKPPVNPWSAAHWPGVSSSGSGVATAAGTLLRRSRNRHAGIDPIPVHDERDNRAQADLGSGQSRRRICARRIDGPCRPDGKKRDRRSGLAQRDCRSGS